MHIIGAPSSFESYGSRSIKIHFFGRGVCAKSLATMIIRLPTLAASIWIIAVFFRTPATNIKNRSTYHLTAFLFSSNHMKPIYCKCVTSVFIRFFIIVYFVARYATFRCSLLAVESIVSHFE